MKTKISSHWPLTAFSSFSALANLALPLVLVRVLTPEGVGHYKIFFLYLGLMPWLAMSAGINNGLYHWAAKSDFTLYFKMSWTLLLSLAVLVSSLAAVVFALFAQNPVVAPVLFVMGIFLVLIAGFHEETLVASGQTWRGAVFAAFFDILRTALVLVTAIQTQNLERIIAAFVLGLSIKSLFGMYFGRRLDYQKVSFDFERKKPQWKEILGFAVPVSAAGLLAVVTHYADQLVLSQLTVASYFAAYSLGCLSVPPLNSFEQAINRVMIPELGKAIQADPELNEPSFVFREAMAELSWILIPATAGLVLFADPIVRLLFTDRYAHVAIFLRLYAFNYLLLAFPYDAYARAKGDSGWIFKNLVLGLVFAVVAIPLLGYYFLGVGALIGLLSTQLILRLGGLIYIHHQSAGRSARFLPLSEIFYDTGCVVILGAACWFAKVSLGGGLTWFLVSGSFFTLAYFILTLRRRFSTHLSSRARPAVVHLTQYLEMGGLERVILSLCAGAQSASPRRIDSFVFSYDLRADARRLTEDFAQIGVSVQSVRKGEGFSLSSLRGLIRHCRLEKISLIHSHDLGPLMYAVAAKILTLGALKVVHTQHSFVHLGKKRRYRLYERFFTLWVDALVVVSRDGAEKYVALGLPRSCIEWIPNGVEFPDAPGSDFRPGLSDDVPALKTQQGKIWVLYLARIHSQKGQIHAVELWMKLPERVRSQAVLILVGQESSPGEIEKLTIATGLAKDSGSVVLAGPTSDPMKWLEQSDLLVSLSEFEGMPLSPVEAYGAGLPLVLSKIPGHEAFADLDSVTWIDLTPGSVEDASARFSGAIASLVDASLSERRLVRRERFNAHKAWRERHSVQAMIEKYLRVYEKAGIRF